MGMKWGSNFRWHPEFCRRAVGTNEWSTLHIRLNSYYSLKKILLRVLFLKKGKKGCFLMKASTSAWLSWFCAFIYLYEEAFSAAKSLQTREKIMKKKKNDVYLSWKFLMQAIMSAGESEIASRFLRYTKTNLSRWSQIFPVRLKHVE